MLLHAGRLDVTGRKQCLDGVECPFALSDPDLPQFHHRKPGREGCVLQEGLCTFSLRGPETVQIWRKMSRLNSLSRVAPPSWRRISFISPSILLQGYVGRIMPSKRPSRCKRSATTPTPQHGIKIMCTMSRSSFRFLHLTHLIYKRLQRAKAISSLYRNANAFDAGED